jgi:sirohydrochlorin ferrochelatase
MSRSALIVAHGQPSDPGPAEAEIATLAARVGALLPDWVIGSATLADPGSLERALPHLTDPVVFPFFMSDGWFIRTELPRRLTGAGAEGLRILPPFGLLGPTDRLATTTVRQAAKARNWSEGDTTLILAAHGSGASRRPAETASRTREAILAATGYREVRLGFIEESPHLADVLADAGQQSLLLPLFVARWGHVAGDIPEAVDATGYRGAVLDPLGCAEEVPRIIADALLT